MVRLGPVLHKLYIKTAGTHSFCTADMRMVTILTGAAWLSRLSQDWSRPRMIGLGGK
jgi:hypothetical protein